MTELVYESLISRKSAIVEFWSNYSKNNLLVICAGSLTALLFVIFLLGCWQGNVPIINFALVFSAINVISFVLFKTERYEWSADVFLIASGLLGVIFSILGGGQIMIIGYLINVVTVSYYLISGKRKRIFYSFYFLLTEMTVLASYFWVTPTLEIAYLDQFIILFSFSNISFQLFLMHYIGTLIEQRHEQVLSARENYRKAVAKTAATLESTHSGIVFIDNEGKLGQYNQTFVDIWKINKKTPNDNDLLCSVVEAAANPGAFIKLFRQMEAEPTAKTQGEILLENGQVIQFRTEPHRVNNELTGRVWIFEDITKEKITARELESSERLFRGFFEHSPVGIMITNDAEYIRYVNQKLLSLLGYTEAEMYRLKISDIIPDEELKGRAERYEKLKKGIAHSVEIEKQYKCKNGTLMPVRITVSLIRDQEGEVIQDILIVQDLTQEKAAQVALQHRETQFRNIFEHAPFPLFLFSDNLVIDCNQPALEFLGVLDKKQIRETPLKKLMPIVQEDGQLSMKVFQGMTEKARTLGSHSFEWTITNVRGENKTVLFTITRYELQGEEVFFAIWNDLTDQKAGEAKIGALMQQLTEHNQQLEGEIERRMVHQKEINQELKRSNLDLQQFAYIASHDLQEPLRMIGNFIQLLEKKYGDRIEDDGRKFIGYAVEGVNRMSRLIENLLEFSKAGHHDVYFEKADLNEIVNNKMLDLYQRIVEKRSCIDMHLLPEIFCAPEQIGIVFYNLVGNAIKFNESKTPRVVVTNEERAEDWLFTVRDNGIGIPAGYADKIFQIFQRLHRRDTYDGTGIGLSLCKRIVTRHKGSIWFESMPGEGTTFYFTISKSIIQRKQLVK